MPRQKKDRRPVGTGSIVYRGKGKNKRMYLRTRYRDEQGQVKDKFTRIYAKSEGTEVAQEDRRDLKTYGPTVLEGARVTFAEVAAEYEQRYLVEAKYVGEVKVAGLRHVRTPKAILKNVLVPHFGTRRIQVINRSEIEQFRLLRLNTPIVYQKRRRVSGAKSENGQLIYEIITHEKQRSIRTVNYELQVLRAVFYFAETKGWLKGSPRILFRKLISQADETRRERLLTVEEEERLLAACTGPREHLRPILIAALDTTLRRGSLFQLKWSDVDFEHRLIRVRKTTTKTLKKVVVGMTRRLEEELRKLWEASDQNPDALVFGITDTVKRSFATACRLAGITDLRLHDLRGRASTDILEAGIPEEIARKVTQHTQAKTFREHYVRADETTARRIAEALDRLQETRRKAAGAAGR